MKIASIQARLAIRIRKCHSPSEFVGVIQALQRRQAIYSWRKARGDLGQWVWSVVYRDLERVKVEF